MPSASAASVAATRSGAVTPPPAPWPRTSAARASSAGCRWTRAGPCGVSTIIGAVTLLADLVAASDAVAATSSRSRKIAVLADLLRGLDPGEAPVAAGLLSRPPRQGPGRVGYSTG